MSPAFRDVAPKRIAVFQALFLGDLLCAVPAINALKRRFSAAEITLIGLPWARELAIRLSSVDRFEVFPGHPALIDWPPDDAAIPGFYERMRERRFDLAVQMHGSGGVTNDIVAAFGARKTIGYGTDTDRAMTAVLPWVEEEREVRRWLRLVSIVGAEIGETQITLPVFDEDRRRADELLAGLPKTVGPVIGLHGGAKDPGRRWPAERFAELGDALARRHGARIVLTGAAGEQPLTSAIARRMQSPALDLAGATDLGALAAVIERLDLLVTNDTGASHVAAATATPSVIVCGPSRPSRWAPLDAELHIPVDAHVVVDPALDLADALRLLAVAPVLAACERQLATSRAGLALTEVVA